MTALMRYHLAALVHGQRYLAALLFDVVVLTVFTANDSGPLVGSYVVSAGSLLIVMCWLTVTLLGHEDPVRRAVTAVTAGGSGRVLLADVLLALLIGAGLTVVGTVFPIVSGRHEWTAWEVVVGVAAQGTAVLTGVGVGLLCSRAVVPRPGYSLVLALTAVIALLVTPGLPPVNPVLRLMSGTRPAVEQLPPVLAGLLAAAVLLAACAAVTRGAQARRD